MYNGKFTLCVNSLLPFPYCYCSQFTIALCPVRNSKVVDPFTCKSKNYLWFWQCISWCYHPQLEKAWVLMHPLYPFQRGHCCWKCRKNGLWMELSRGKALQLTLSETDCIFNFVVVDFEKTRQKSWNPITSRKQPTSQNDTFMFSKKGK